MAHLIELQSLMCIEIVCRSVVPTETGATSPVDYNLLQRTSERIDEHSFIHHQSFLVVPTQTIPGALQPPIYHQSV